MATPMTKTDFDNAIEEINEMAAKKILELERVDKVVQAAVLAEREACAALCDVMANHPEYAESATTKLAAKAIRARGKN
jgi:hypothetical protein